MDTMNIELPESTKQFVEAQVAQSGYGSTSAYVRDLTRADQLRRAKCALEAKRSEALESGPASPVSAEDWAELRREALARMPSETIRQYMFLSAVLSHGTRSVPATLKQKTPPALAADFRPAIVEGALVSGAQTSG